ncbi:MAG: DMT family transporter [Parachlamydiales bacterium]|nr:DMT family transporter [Parachlamydiales bacterium]
MMLAPKEPKLLFGILVTILAYLCFAISAAIVRSFPKHFPTAQIIFIQNLISLIFILPSFYKKRKIYKLRKELIPLHLVRSVAGVASFFCYFLAIKKMNLVDATVLTYTAPFYTPIIWTLWTKEKMEKSVWWTIILGFIGIALIMKPSHHILKAGSILGIFAGIISAVALIAVRRLNQKLESLTRTLFYYFLIGTIGCLPIALINWQNPTLIQFSMLLSMGSLLALGQLFLTTAYKHGTASFLSPISYSMIIFTGLISWMIFKQIPGWVSFFGACLIIIGGTISYIIKVKPGRFIEIFEHSHEEKIHFWNKLKLKHHHIEFHKKCKNTPINNNLNKSEVELKNTLNDSSAKNIITDAKAESAES